MGIEKQIEEIINLYNKENVCISDISKKFNLKSYIVHKILVENNIKIVRRSKTIITDDKIKHIIDLYVNEKYSVSFISRFLSLNRKTIKKILYSHSISINGGRKYCKIKHKYDSTLITICHICKKERKFSTKYTKKKKI